jgi:hypothetical protein
MTKYTWMIIALVLAVAAGLLIKDADNQPIIMQAINYVRTPNVVVDDAEVATGTDADMPTGADADMPSDDADMATGTDADDTMPSDDDADVATGTDADDTMPSADVVPAGEGEVGIEVN